MDEEKFDVVIDALTERRDKLWHMTKRNMESDYIGFNIMDQIRLRHIEEIDDAIQMWKNRPKDEDN